MKKETTVTDWHEDELVQELVTILTTLGIAEPLRVIEEFELDTIGDDQLRLHKPIAKKIHDRIDSFALLLEGLLQPDQSLATMHECSFFDEREQTRIVRTYRHLMHTLRGFTEADLVATDKAFDAFTLKALDTWTKEKETILAHTRKLQEGWAKEQKLHGEKGYFG